MKKCVGVIGLGLLGSALCERLCAAGFSVLGFDTDSAARQRCQQRGVALAEDAGGVLSSVSTCILSLPDSDVVRIVLTENVPPAGLVILDTTTGQPAAIRQLATELAERQVGYFEANVAGSSEQLRAGRATLFVGGNADALAEQSAVLTALSPQQFHVGQCGDAATLKLVHNLILGLNRAVLAEGLALGERCGLDPRQMLDVLQSTPAASAAMLTKGLKIISRDYQPQARLAQHLKDVRLILDQADAVQAITPLSKLHRQLLERADELGFGASDNSAIAEVFRETPDENSDRLC